MITYVFCKMFIRSSSFQKKYWGGQTIKDTHFIGVRVGCLKINRNSDKILFFFQNEHFYLFNKTYTESPTRITFTCVISIFSCSFQKLFITENGRPYLVDFEWRVSHKFIFIILKWSAKNFMTTDAKKIIFSSSGK